MRFLPLLLAAVVLSPSLPAAARAQSTPDPVALAPVATGHAKVRLTVTAGPSGAPDGFTVTWMPRRQFESLGSQWPATPVPGQGTVTFHGLATLNTWGDTERSFRLGPGERLDVEIGDLFDESGVAGTVAPELADGEEYVFAAVANGASATNPSVPSVTVDAVTSLQGIDCTYTIGFWKTHPDLWPVAGLTIGSVDYTKSQLLQILAQPVQGNGLLSLSHQLIATLLNLASGVDGSAVAGALPDAYALIGGLTVPPAGSGSLAASATSSLVQIFDDYNNGITGPGHCSVVATRRSSWGELKGLYR